ncbi:MAG: phosphoribosyltransferase [Actinomycetota bacterium]
MIFRNREEAGRVLGSKLAEDALQGPVLFGIPRGGVIVAAAAARRLGGLLDIIVSAKIRAPYQPELGLGAVAPDGSLYLDERMIFALGVSDEYLEREIALRKEEIDRRTRAYRGERGEVPVKDRPAVIVDDGIATGGTATCAARYLRAREPSELILAVPVAPASMLAKLREEVDRVVCLHAVEPFVAVGQWYLDFGQVSDDEVRHALEESAR